MPTAVIVYGENILEIETQAGDLLGEVVQRSGLPLEQPCAGRGTCGKCKVLVEGHLVAPDEVESAHLKSGEIAVGTRLACRARISGDVRILLAPIVIYSNKVFKLSRYDNHSPSALGLAIDLGSTTVAAFLTRLEDGAVLSGGASLNQQTVYGADVIARLAAALINKENALRLKRLALASINQAVDSLKLTKREMERVERATVVGNSAMHHLLTGLPVDSLALKPFQPYSRYAILEAGELLQGIFPSKVQVKLPPLIGGFVGSDALACLAYFNFDRSRKPIAAIDLGTNGEVLVTDGERILTASTAAGPAFEGVNISCGTRAVDGAVSSAFWDGDDLVLKTIGEAQAIGLTGSGLISVVHVLRQHNLIEASGKIAPDAHLSANWVESDSNGWRRLRLNQDGSLCLTQNDIRELQKAKGAIRAAFDTLLARLSLKPEDLERVILTGSFGGQIDVEAALALGVIPPIVNERVQPVANGAGFGAALFLEDAGFERGIALSERAEQVDLDRDALFNRRYIGAMRLTPETQQF